MIQEFAWASDSQCNIEKSILILLLEDASFDPANWNGEVVNKGQVFRHLRMPLGVDILGKKRFK